jgi:hypothetical protein
VQSEATPLFVASYNGHFETVKALIEGRADVEAKAKVSSTSGHQHAVAHERARSYTASFQTRTQQMGHECGRAYRLRARNEGRGGSKETTTWRARRRSQGEDTDVFMGYGTNVFMGCDAM